MARRTKASKSTTKKATPKKGKPAKKVVVKAHPPAERFDRAAYELPVLDLDEAVALATALALAKPAKATPVIVEDAKRVVAARDRAKQALAKGGGVSVDARAHDVAMDRAWATFVRRIEDHVELPPEHHPHKTDATKVFAIVRDLSILKLNYLAEFAQIGARLDAIKREGLLDEARRFAGDAFVDEVLRCHAEYGAALGVMPAAVVEEKSSALDRGAARIALVESIAEYTYQVLALARAGQPDTWATVDKALRAIPELRKRQEAALHAVPARPKPAAHPPVARA